MSFVTYDGNNLSTNSRAYELLMESKKDPEKLKALKKHIESVKKEAKEASKNNLTPAEYLASMGFKLTKQLVPNHASAFDYFEDTKIHRVDQQKITADDIQRFESVRQLFLKRFPDVCIFSSTSD